MDQLKRALDFPASVSDFDNVISRRGAENAEKEAINLIRFLGVLRASA